MERGNIFTDTLICTHIHTGYSDIKKKETQQNENKDGSTAQATKS